MVADREAAAFADNDDLDRQPPLQVPIGNAGSGTAPDQTSLVELARFEKQNPRRRPARLRPDPAELARIFLTNTEFKDADWNAVAPLLRAAEANYQVEKQFRRK